MAKLGRAQWAEINKPIFVAANRSKSGGYWPQVTNILTADKSKNRRVLYGDWEKFRFIIQNMTPALAIGLKAAARKSAISIVKNIRKGVRNQAPAGEKFKKLHPFTIKDKLSGRGLGSSTANKALIRSGSLLKQLTYKIRDDGSFEVGYDASSVSGSSGVYLWMVATWMQNTTKRPATKKMKAMMASSGFPIKKSTKFFYTPKRPFIEPVFRSMKKEIASNYMVAINRALSANSKSSYDAIADYINSKS